MQQHPPCSVVPAQVVKLQIRLCTVKLGMPYVLTKPKTNNNNPNTKPNRGLTFRSIFRLHLRFAQMGTSATAIAYQLTDLHYECQRMQKTSIRSDAFSNFGSTRLVAEHAQWKRKMWPITKASVSTRHQKFLWTPGSVPKHNIRINGKRMNSVSCEPAGKHSEKLQRCLNFARQELPLCGSCNYQPCAQQEGIMAEIR